MASVQLDLVAELRRVPPEEVQLLEADGTEEGAQIRRTELGIALQPAGVLHQMVEEHRVTFRNGVVAEPSVLVLKVGLHVREVERMPELVEERVPVRLAAVRPHDEVYLVRHAHRRAERARSLPFPVAGI